MNDRTGLMRVGDAEYRRTDLDARLCIGPANGSALTGWPPPTRSRRVEIAAVSITSLATFFGMGALVPIGMFTRSPIITTLDDDDAGTNPWWADFSHHADAPTPQLVRVSGDDMQSANRAAEIAESLTFVSIPPPED